MEKKNVILTFVLLLLVTLYVSAGSDTNNSNPNDLIVILKSYKPSGRPEVPSHQEIKCEYSDGCLILDFRYP